MKSILSSLVTFHLVACVLTAQQFHTPIFVQNTQGLDTVIIGYDISASIDVDSQFGEMDILNMPFDTAYTWKMYGDSAYEHRNGRLVC